MELSIHTVALSWQHLPYAAQNVPSRFDSQELVGRGGQVVVAGLLVGEVGVRHPEVLQVLGADVERHQTVLRLKRQPGVLPELTEKEVACEVLEWRAVLA